MASLRLDILLLCMDFVESAHKVSSNVIFFSFLVLLLYIHTHAYIEREGVLFSTFVHPPGFVSAYSTGVVQPSRLKSKYVNVTEEHLNSFPRTNGFNLLTRIHSHAFVRPHQRHRSGSIFSVVMLRPSDCLCLQNPRFSKLVLVYEIVWLIILCFHCATLSTRPL